MALVLIDMLPVRNTPAIERLVGGIARGCPLSVGISAWRRDALRDGRLCVLLASLGAGAGLISDASARHAGKPLPALRLISAMARLGPFPRVFRAATGDTRAAHRGGKGRSLQRPPARVAQSLPPRA